MNLREKNLIRIISDLRNGLLHTLKNGNFKNEDVKIILDEILNFKNSTEILKGVKKLKTKKNDNDNLKKSLLKTILEQSNLNLPLNIKKDFDNLYEKINNNTLNLEHSYLEYHEINKKITHHLAIIRSDDSQIKRARHFNNFKSGVNTVIETDLIFATRNIANSIKNLIQKLNENNKDDPLVINFLTESENLHKGELEFFGGLDLLSRVTDFVIKMKLEEQELYKKHFFSIQDKLNSIYNVINSQITNNDSLNEIEHEFIQDFQKEIDNLKNHTKKTTTLEDLKNTVFINLENIQDNIKIFKEKQNTLRIKSNNEINNLKKQITKLTDEQSEFQNIIEEKDNQIVVDELTSIKNKIGYQKDIKKIYNLWKENKSEKLNLGIIDIDHFKSINDRFGHDVGDIVLKEIASSVNSIIKTKGTIYRWGGEEFVLILPNAELKESTEELKKIRLFFENNPIKINSELMVPITISGGVATFKTEADTPQTVFKKADNALYHSKNNGRNKISYHKIKVDID